MKTVTRILLLGALVALAGCAPPLSPAEQAYMMRMNGVDPSTAPTLNTDQACLLYQSAFLQGWAGATSASADPYPTTGMAGNTGLASNLALESAYNAGDLARTTGEDEIQAMNAFMAQEPECQ